MIRKPFPEEAASRMREYLSQNGIELSKRKALNLVAFVEGYESWQAMHALTRPAVLARDKKKAPEVTAYANTWAYLQDLAYHHMDLLAFHVRQMCTAEYRVNSVVVEHDDESCVTFWIENMSASGVAFLVASLTLVENEEVAGQFALRLTIEDPRESTELVSWTSGPRYSKELWCVEAEQLAARLTADFMPIAIAKSLYSTAASKFFEPRP